MKKINKILVSYFIKKYIKLMNFKKLSLIKNNDNDKYLSLSLFLINDNLLDYNFFIDYKFILFYGVIWSSIILIWVTSVGYIMYSYEKPKMFPTPISEKEKTLMRKIYRVFRILISLGRIVYKWKFQNKRKIGLIEALVIIYGSSTLIDNDYLIKIFESMPGDYELEKEIKEGESKSEQEKWGDFNEKKYIEEERKRKELKKLKEKNKKIEEGKNIIKEYNLDIDFNRDNNNTFISEFDYERIKKDDIKEEEILKNINYIVKDLVDNWDGSSSRVELTAISEFVYLENYENIEINKIKEAKEKFMDIVEQKKKLINRGLLIKHAEIKKVVDVLCNNIKKEVDLYYLEADQMIYMDINHWEERYKNMWKYRQLLYEKQEYLNYLIESYAKWDYITRLDLKYNNYEKLRLEYLRDLGEIYNYENINVNELINFEMLKPNNELTSMIIDPHVVYDFIREREKLLLYKRDVYQETQDYKKNISDLKKFKSNILDHEISLNNDLIENLNQNILYIEDLIYDHKLRSIYINHTNKIELKYDNVNYYLYNINKEPLELPVVERDADTVEWENYIKELRAKRRIITNESDSEEAIAKINKENDYNGIDTYSYTERIKRIIEDAKYKLWSEKGLKELYKLLPIDFSIKDYAELVKYMEMEKNKKILIYIKEVAEQTLESEMYKNLWENLIKIDKQASVLNSEIPLIFTDDFVNQIGMDRLLLMNDILIKKYILWNEENIENTRRIGENILKWALYYEREIKGYTYNFGSFENFINKYYNEEDKKDVSFWWQFYYLKELLSLDIIKTEVEEKIKRDIYINIIKMITDYELKCGVIPSFDLFKLITYSL